MLPDHHMAAIRAAQPRRLLSRAIIAVLDAQAADDYRTLRRMKYPPLEALAAMKREDVIGVLTRSAVPAPKSPGVGAGKKAGDPGRAASPAAQAAA